MRRAGADREAECAVPATMTTDVSLEERLLDDESLRAARVRALEKAFEIALTPDESARCTSAEAMTAVFAARVDAAPGPANLHASAMAAVRESLRAVVRADSESVEEHSDLDLLRGGVSPSSVWRGLAHELRCRLPPLRYTWQAAGLTVAVLATQGLLLLAADPMPRIALFVVVILMAGTLAPLWMAAVAIQRGRFPGSMGRVGALADWLVARHPLRLRGGTEWTSGQVAEVVAATFQLDFAGRRLGVLAPSLVTPLLAVASAALGLVILFQVVVAGA